MSQCKVVTRDLSRYIDWHVVNKECLSIRNHATSTMVTYPEWRPNHVYGDLSHCSKVDIVIGKQLTKRRRGLLD